VWVCPKESKKVRYVDKDSERVWLCERGRISEVFAILSLSLVCVWERVREGVRTSNDMTSDFKKKSKFINVFFVILESWDDEEKVY